MLNSIFRGQSGRSARPCDVGHDRLASVNRQDAQFGRYSHKPASTAEIAPFAGVFLPAGLPSGRGLIAASSDDKSGSDDWRRSEERIEGCSVATGGGALLPTLYRTAGGQAICGPRMLLSCPLGRG
ncbi:hypothetical protein C5Y97_07025 [Blastopirellula marina]|uniref:Uncharacterized protein n=1 Tax=Blastopirellula marina TaxID=124 RepID=A0A2S8G6Y9_9BACT|nr:hypothetical protein C5Y98_07025 [Blastopirellula marina]PTL45435.1 hypothetical protein C5Y97_07025 [Blastopirellula marina]